MISIDANVLIRLFTGDDKEQAAKAKHLFAREDIYITKTVILETEWVLRHAYGFKAGEILPMLLQNYWANKMYRSRMHIILPRRQACCKTGWILPMPYI